MRVDIFSRITALYLTLFLAVCTFRVKEVAGLLEKMPPIYAALENVREENHKHSQYATAIGNLKQIFEIQASVANTMQLIEEDKLLQAHQCLAGLENSRDDMLFELHKLPKQSAHDKMTLKRYFEKVETVSQQLERKIRLIMTRTLATVRKEPTIIVTALRLIEREEKSDQFALQQQKQSGFLPPGRPKEWRRKTMEVLQKAVVDRVEGSKLEERADNKLWLVRDLELVRQFVLEDLRVVKWLCTPCFPERYNIFGEYVRMYNEVLGKYVSVNRMQDVLFATVLIVCFACEYSSRRSCRTAWKRTSTSRCCRG